MPLETDFYEALTVTFTVERYKGRDQWGNALYAMPESFKGRLENFRYDRGRGEMRDNRITPERENLSTIICDTHGFTTYDRFTLPDGRVPTVVSVDTNYDENGPHHQVVTLEENRR